MEQKPDNTVKYITKSRNLVEEEASFCMIGVALR